MARGLPLQSSITSFVRSDRKRQGRFEEEDPNRHAHAKINFNLSMQLATQIWIQNLEGAAGCE